MAVDCVDNFFQIYLPTPDVRNCLQHIGPEAGRNTYFRFLSSYVDKVPYISTSIFCKHFLGRGPQLR